MFEKISVNPPMIFPVSPPPFFGDKSCVKTQKHRKIQHLIPSFSEVSKDESSEELSPSLEETENEEEEELVQILPDPEIEDVGIELEETPDLDENLGISVRSSYQDGWSCFATIGHFGTCRN